MVWSVEWVVGGVLGGGRQRSDTGLELVLSRGEGWLVTLLGEDLANGLAVTGTLFFFLALFFCCFLALEDVLVFDGTGAFALSDAFAFMPSVIHLTFTWCHIKVRFAFNHLLIYYFGFYICTDTRMRIHISLRPGAVMNDEQIPDLA